MVLFSMIKHKLQNFNKWLQKRPILYPFGQLIYEEIFNTDVTYAEKFTYLLLRGYDFLGVFFMKYYEFLS